MDSTTKIVKTICLIAHLDKKWRICHNIRFLRLHAKMRLILVRGGKIFVNAIYNVKMKITLKVIFPFVGQSVNDDNFDICGSLERFPLTESIANIYNVISYKHKLYKD